MIKRLNKSFGVYAISLVVVVLFVGIGFTLAASNPVDEIVKMYLSLKAGETSETPDVDNDGKEVGFSNSGTEIVVTKKIDYDDITTTGVDLTNEVTGDFVIENIILESSSHTIASGTQIVVISSGDTYGTSTPVFATDVNAFPKATTMDLNTLLGSVSGTYSGYASSTQRIVLEDGSKLIIKCTTADCKKSTSAGESGTGYIRATTILRKANTWSYTYE